MLVLRNYWTFTIINRRGLWTWRRGPLIIVITCHQISTELNHVDESLSEHDAFTDLLMRFLPSSRMCDRGGRIINMCIV